MGRRFSGSPHIRKKFRRRPLPIHEPFFPSRIRPRKESMDCRGDTRVTWMFPGGTEPITGVSEIAFAAMAKGVKKIEIGVAFVSLGRLVGGIPMILPKQDKPDKEVAAERRKSGRLRECFRPLPDRLD